MNVTVSDTRAAAAPAATVFEVLTDYPAYPRFHPAVARTRIVRKDTDGAEVLVEYSTRTRYTVRVRDRYPAGRQLTVARRADVRPTDRTAWTITPVGPDRCAVSIATTRSVRTAAAVLFLARQPRIRRRELAPFIVEAERRARRRAA